MGDYHHGDLHNALLIAARSVMHEKGIHGLSLRACAAKAGVSHAAPTHHFKSLSGLLTELATIAYGEFTAALRLAQDDAPQQATAQQRLQIAGEAYVQFALSEPELFKLMFDSPLPDHCDEKLCAVSALAYGELTRVVKPLCDAQGITEAQAITEMEMLVWSLIHGFASLALKHRGADGAIRTTIQGFPDMAMLGTLFATEVEG